MATRSRQLVSMSRSKVMIIFALITGIAFAIVEWTSAYASTLYVNGSSGTDSGNCQSSPCKTIGYAINQAVSGDTINVSAGIYIENLHINKSLTITGGGAGNTIIDGNGGVTSKRVIEIDAGNNVSISGLGIQNGQDIYGGGISSGGNLVLTDVIVMSNTSVKHGGGIYNQGNLRVINSAITNNSTDGPDGLCGGIANAGYLGLRNSQVIGNRADYTGGGICNVGTVEIFGLILANNISRYGGGIISSRPNTMTLESSTVSTNTATVSGGGILNGGFALVSNATVSGNKADSAGGGIGNGGFLRITNSTINGNTITNTLGTGNAIYNGTASDSYVRLANTIIAGAGTPNCGTDVGLGIISLGNNLSSDNTCNLTNTGDITNTNPILGPLQTNWPGTTQTHALLNGSPAIDAGSNFYCPSFDQRGVARPVGLNCDIGAFEFVPVIYFPIIFR